MQCPRLRLTARCFCIYPSAKNETLFEPKGCNRLLPRVRYRAASPKRLGYCHSVWLRLQPFLMPVHAIFCLPVNCSGAYRVPHGGSCCSSHTFRDNECPSIPGWLPWAYTASLLTRALLPAKWLCRASQNHSFLHWAQEMPTRIRPCEHIQSPCRPCF